MKDKVIDRLLELRSEEAVLNESIGKIEDTAKPLKDELTKIQSEMGDIKNLILSDMTNQNIKSYTHGDKLLTAAIRKTMSIVDEEAVMWHFMNDKLLLKKAAKTLGLKGKEIKKNLILTVLNKPLAKEYAEALVTVDGVKVEGTEMKETTYLTIK